MDTIARVEAIPVSYPEPNDFDALRHLCLVRITTADGIVGWGESITMWPEATFAVKALVEGMAELVLGRDPLDNIAIWHALHDRAWWYGYGGGIASFAIAAIDIALWDVKGKSLGLPVVQLLGGAVHERLPAVASCHAHHADIGRMVEEAQEWVAPGLHGVKVGFGKRGDAHLGYEHDRDVEYMRRMRQGLGPDQLIMIDCGWKTVWDVMTATRRIQAFEEWGLHWIEEPLGAWDPLATPTCEPAPRRSSPTGRRSGTSRATSACSPPGPWTSSASIPAGPRASPASARSPNGWNSTADSRTRTPGRRPS